ncbi:alpha/beta hydrolase fold domain-containing protein [Streptomyces sp. NPDC046900]|uniref:flavin-containing monooxygenase n=1 Tax=Streptomyces sp. NPDC046900 TaxID=3155473 RepID=UPI0033CE3A3B
MRTTQKYDAIVIGAGFAGMYLLHRLRDDLGLQVRVYERGNGVGGTWYWNRYPGARCDVESMFYSYSFSEDLEQEWEWTERYPTQPEILRYANHVADRFGLREDIEFNTSVKGARYDETTDTWTVTLQDGGQASARYLVTAVGCLSASRVPDFEGLDSFTGPTYHTGRWPHEGVDFTGKRVAVVGTGSSGIQAIPVIAQQAAHVTVFQRTPNFSIPAQNRPLSQDEQRRIKAEYRQPRADARNSAAGVITPPALGNALDVDEELRSAELDRRWAAGGAAFVSAFTDAVIDEEANRVTADYVRDRIRETTKDPDVAELLCPKDHPIGTKRICVDTDYYATYNRDNVTLVGLRGNPIECITPTGLRVGGVDHEVDAIVFATGYDAMTGPLNAIDIRGLDGTSLREEWADGPRTYLGVAAAGFPNLFMVTAPGSPSVLSNMIVSIEQHGDWITDAIAHARQAGIARIDARREAQHKWVEHVNEVASHTLYPHAASWYMGANVPGKPRVFMPYLGGVGTYRQICDEIAGDGYRGFTLTPAVTAQPARSIRKSDSPEREGTQAPMTTIDSPAGTRHLVDPEVAPVLDVFPPLNLSPETLPEVRQAQSAPIPDAPDPQALYPDVTTTERWIPGFESDPDVRILHYEPKARTTPSSALVWIHGGGYVLGKADIDEILCRRIATETGASVVSVDYRLAPETKEPGLVHDCYAALRWVHDNSEDLGMHRGRIAVGGASAGGGLAATLAILARDRGEVPVSFQLLIYPMLDDRTASTENAHPYAGEFIWTPGDNRFGWTSILGREPGGDDVSPYTAAARVESVAGLPPAFISVGALDLFAEEDIAYGTRLIRAGIPTELHVYPGAYHAYDMVPDARVTQAHFRDCIGALGRHFNG